MECITYTLDFHGRLSSVRPGVYELDAIAEDGRSPAHASSR